MRPKHTILLIFLIFAYTTGAYAQEVNVQRVLYTSFSDDKVLRYAEMERFSRTLNYNLPAIKKVELKLGINGNNNPDTLDGSLRNEDYYAVNISPNKWKEMKLQKEVKPTQTNLYTREMEMQQMQALLERYQLVVNLYFTLELLKNKTDLQDLLNKKNTLLQKMLNEGITVKINDALDIDRDLVQLYGLLLEDEKSASIYKARLKQYLNTSQALNINFSDIISVRKIIENSLTLRQDSLDIHPALNYKEAQYLLAKANYKLELSQNTNILEYVQLGYNRPVYSPEILKKFKPENTLTFRVGISVPITGNYNLNRNNANLQQYNALLNWQSAQTIQNNSIRIQEMRLSEDIKHYNALVEINKKSIVNKLLENKDVMAQSTALEIIDLKIARKKLEISLINSSQTVMQSYILLLESKGLLKYDIRQKYLLE